MSNFLKNFLVVIVDDDEDDADDQVLIIRNVKDAEARMIQNLN